ncbi:hypothetical protein [Terriglobus albidus]|uniref:hypothetical protein n=1 Tax=Terriglobus albidus TaxID=1592106 RepID=UPI0021E06B6E|nr:hypothetical protein [Terriglobus albidus]
MLLVTVRRSLSARRFHTFSLAAFLLSTAAAICQDVVKAAPSPTPLLWKSDHALHLIGLIESKPNIEGILSISPTTITFATSSGQTTIERARIFAISAGDMHMEKGGTLGRFSRKVIPYGGGSVIAAVTHKQVDLLTVEFRDAHDAYHGAVFLLPKLEALNAAKLFGSPLAQAKIEEQQHPCVDGTAGMATLKISTIDAADVPVPTEYKVLLYEQLIRRLQADAGFGQVFRDGDRASGAACPMASLALSLSAFNKGNAAVRASTGPLGMFLGVTSLKFHVHLQDYQGKVLLDKDLKETERGDSDSLDIANKLAKSVTKKLKKTAAHQKPA